MGERQPNIYIQYKMPKTQATAKRTASKVAQPVKKAVHKVYNKPRFYKPKTRHVARQPKLLRRLKQVITKPGRQSAHKVMLQPVTSEKNVVRMEEENTLTYLVPLHVNKVQVKRAAEELWKVKIRSVRTLVRPDGKKKAFIRLAPGSDSLKVASKLGII